MAVLAMFLNVLAPSLIIQGVRSIDVTPFPYNNIHLPSNVIPVEYILFMHPNITDGKFGVTGHVTVIFDVKRVTNFVILHSKSHTYYQTGVREYPVGRELSVSRIRTHKRYEFLLVELDEELSVTKRYAVEIAFGGYLNTRLSGFYKSSYVNENGKTIFFATTDFEPTGARLAFPCFDEPNMKARFTVTMVREKQHTSLSNMPVERQHHRPDGLVEDHFQTSVKMSTYLVAFVVCDFAHLSTNTTRGVKVRVWAPKHLISQATYALHVTPKILEYYEKFFKINFPLPKQDLIAIPDYKQGAMENWGLITYRLTALLYDPVMSSTADQQWVCEVIAHELAHSWLGDLVTLDWWNDIWLNEGFAEYMQNVGMQVIGGNEWRLMDQFVVNKVQSAMASDSKLISHPISVPVKKPIEIEAMFDIISYEKGSSIIRMMKDFIGPDWFKNGLSNYLNRHAYGNAVSDDLWYSLSEATGHKLNVKSVMDTWVKQMGYPVIDVERDTVNNVAIITQERFVSERVEAGKVNPSPYNYTWEVPLTYYFQHSQPESATQRNWLHRNQTRMVIPWKKTDGWVKLNRNQVGFYRVNYDNENWESLRKQLMQNHTVLSAADRANIIDDAFALGNAGKLSLTKALGLTKYLKKEEDYIPFSSALSSLSYIGEMLLHREGYKYYEKYILQQVGPLYEKLGWEDKGRHLQRFLRTIILQKAVQYNYKDAVAMAMKLYSDWMSGHHVIPVDIRSTVYMAGIKYGGEKEWNFMFEMFKKCKLPAEKRRLMSSLTYSKDRKILKWYLQNALNETVIRSQDASFLIARISLNPIVTDITLQFIVRNWNVLLKRNYLGTVLEAAFRGGKTIEVLNRARTIFTTHRLGTSKGLANQILTSITTNIKWLKKNEKNVVDWLKRNVNGKS